MYNKDLQQPDYRLGLCWLRQKEHALATTEAAGGYFALSVINSPGNPDVH
jgi:hypothetical protein